MEYRMRNVTHGGGSLMTKTVQSNLGTLWCSLMHDSAMWPVHGEYQCRMCGRRYPAFGDPDRGPATKVAHLLLIGLVVAFAAPVARSAELQAGTLAAWQAYLHQSDVHMQERIEGRARFLWMDESPDHVARVRRGEAVIAPVAGRGTESVPDGLVHHWIGAIFIPGATIENLLAAVHDYDSYHKVYRPAVTSSRTLACAENRQEFQMVWQRKILLVSAAIQGRYQARDVMLDSTRGYSVAETVEVREIEGYRHSGERLLPPDTGNGFLWRIRSTARFQERDGGVYLELEAIALTRDIPASMAWMVTPVVNHLSVNSLTTTLRQTRDAVISSRGSLTAAASCPGRAADKPVGP
jgi:hypothetical protein